MTAWFQSVEFYVIAAVVAAAIVGLSALPARRGAARHHTAPGDLLPEATPAEPSLEARVDRDGRLVLVRTSLPTDTIAASLSIEIAGFDVNIVERLTAGRDRPAESNAAMYVLDFFGAERYHFSFDSPQAGLFAAFTLPVRPGIRLSRPLTRG